MDKIIITGAAGFIGFHLAKRCLSNGMKVLAIDNLNPYYDVNLKKARLAVLEQHENFSFLKFCLSDVEKTNEAVSEFTPDYIAHLAAQAGVRYSIKNPFAYVNDNLQGFVSILEAAKHVKVKHFIYASSSSVYGANAKQPFAEDDAVNHPLSIYAASKKANELIAHSYSNLFNMPTTGLRFFTCYGPWGRPDMALFLFTKNILENKPIDVFNHGDMARDFTYIDDAVEAVYRLIFTVAKGDDTWLAHKPNPATSYAPYRVYNVGNHRVVPLMDYVKAIEKALGREAIINYMPMQDGDVVSTCADINRLNEAIDYKTSTTIDDGVARFVDWYVDFYGGKHDG